MITVYAVMAAEPEADPQEGRIMSAQFTLGVIFSADGEHVYLMRKDHPEFQAGKFNGVGGKLEPGETFDECMAREAIEEAGYSGEWREFGTMTWPADTSYRGGGFCRLYCSFMKEGDPEPHTCEREPIEKIAVADIPALFEADMTVPHLLTVVGAALAQRGRHRFHLSITY